LPVIPACAGENARLKNHDYEKAAALQAAASSESSNGKFDQTCIALATSAA
jgi:hypothetical protein